MRWTKRAADELRRSCAGAAEELRTYHAPWGRGKALDAAVATRLAGIGLQRGQLLLNLVQPVGSRTTARKE